MEVTSIIKTLSNETNLQILSILRSGTFNPRELARILQKDESDISRRLRLLERLGIVEGRWIRAGNKNIKVYSLKVDEVRISFEPGEVVIQTSRNGRYEIPIPESKIPKVENFFGREDEIKLLSSPEKRVIVIYGIAGIGKTSLAARVFWDAFWYQVSELDSFDYFIWQIGLFLNSAGYSTLLEYLRGGGREERDILELVLDGIESTGMKLVVDDLHKCTDEKILRLLAFIAGRMEHGLLVILSREKPRLGIVDATYIRLKGLDLKSAYSLIKSRGVKIDLADFVDIYQLTMGHPLALNLFAEAYIEKNEIRPEKFFDFLFWEVYQALNRDERLMLQLLGLFDEPVEYGAIKHVYPKKNAFVVLYSLLNKGLVEKRGELYFLHDLLRNIVKETPEVDEREYCSRYIDYLIEKKNIKDFLRALRYAVRLKDRDKFRELIELRLRRFKRIIQDFPDAYMKVLLQLENDPYVRKELGHIYFQRGFFEKAIRLWLDVEDKLEGIHRADVVSSLADVYMELENFEEAEKYLRELEKIADESEDLEIKLWYHVELTKFKYYMDDPEGALESAFKELEIIRRMEPYPELESLILLHIGDIYLGMEKPEESLKYYHHALEIARANSLPFMEHLAHMELSKAHFTAEDYRKSVEHAGKAVEYYLRVRNYRRAVDALAYRCLSYIGLNLPDRGEKDAEEMIKIAQSTDYPLGWAGYIFLGAAKSLKDEDGAEYLRRGKEKLKKHPWLYDAVLKELGRVYKATEAGDLFAE